MISLHAVVKSPFPAFSWVFFRYCRGSKVFLELPLLQREIISVCLHSRGSPAFWVLSWPPLVSLQQVHVLLMLGAPEQVGSYHNGGEGKEPPPVAWWPHCWGCSPGCGWNSGLPVHIVGSCLVAHPSCPPQCCSQSLYPPAYRTLHLASLNLKRLPWVCSLSLSLWWHLTLEVNLLHYRAWYHQRDGNR